MSIPASGAVSIFKAWAVHLVKVDVVPFASVLPLAIIVYNISSRLVSLVWRGYKQYSQNLIGLGLSSPKSAIIVFNVSQADLHMIRHHARDPDVIRRCTWIFMEQQK